jgi:hypothetical protein
MLSGVALALSELPLELIAQHGLGRRICDRGGEREVQFLFADVERLLPVWREGQPSKVRRCFQGRAPLDGGFKSDAASDLPLEESRPCVRGWSFAPW